MTSAENCEGSAVAALRGSRNACFETWILRSTHVLLLRVPRSSSTTAVACISLVCWYLCTSRCSRRLLTHGMEKYAQSMLRPPSSFSSQKAGQHFYEPLVLFRYVQQSARCGRCFFGSLRRRRVLRCRGLSRWRGRRES